MHLNGEKSQIFPVQIFKTPTELRRVANIARLAQSVEHETLNLRVVGSSPTLGGFFSFTFSKVLYFFSQLVHVL